MKLFAGEDNERDVGYEGRRVLFLADAELDSKNSTRDLVVGGYYISKLFTSDCLIVGTVDCQSQNLVLNSVLLISLILSTVHLRMQIQGPHHHHSVP